MHIHQLSTALTPCSPESAAYNGRSHIPDFLIDGESLSKRLAKYELVTSLGWGSEEYQKEMISYYLLEEPHPVLWYRAPIFVCELCGDLECGFISAKLERKNDLVIWSDFYKDHYQFKINIGPYYFQWTQYQEVIRSTLS